MQKWLLVTLLLMLICGLILEQPGFLLYIQKELTFIHLPSFVSNHFLNGLLIGLIGGLLVGLVYGVYFALLDGFSTMQITEHLRIKPNQGLRSSGRNALFVGLLSILIVGLFAGLFGWLFIGPLFGLLLGLLGGLISGLVGSLQHGGAAYIQHYLLRLFLWRGGTIPQYYVSFLEGASERILLLKVGGGYRFTHPLFLDYFASKPDVISTNDIQLEQPQEPLSSFPSS